MRSWIWLPVVAALALASGGALLARPVAKSVIQSQAAQRGLDWQVNDLELGWFSARLKNNSVRLEGVPSIELQLDDVSVDLGLTSPLIRRVEVLGGRVHLEGTVEQVRSELQRFRSRRAKAKPDASPGAAQASGRTEVIRELDIVWDNAFGVGQRQEVRGLAGERGPSGQRWGANLISLVQGPIQLEVAGATVKGPTGGLDLARITHARAVEARLSYVAEKEALEETADTDTPPEPATPPPKAAAVRKDQQVGFADLLHTDPARVARVRSAFELIKHTLLPRLPPDVEVERLWLSYRRGTEKLSVGPNRLLAKNGKEGLTVSLQPRATTQGTPLALVLQVPSSAELGLARFELEGGPVSLSTLGIKEGALGLLGVPHTSLQGSFDARLDPTGSELSAHGQFTVEGLRMDSPRLAPEIVTFPKIFVSGRANVAVDGSFYEVSGAELSLGQARMQGDFALRRGADFVTLRANLDAPLVSCQALLDSAPRGLLGQVADIRFDGTFSLKAGIEADSRSLSKMKVRWDFENACRAKAVPRALDPDQFRGAFRREVIGSGMLPVDLEFGPHSLSWTPLDEVSPHVESAILVSEDGRFYRHDGFDDRAMESAIAQNTRAGRFVRGASTISMQLAKNLYLSRQKTLSRKLQEAALTALLEQNFEKRELLELYMNIVEFGPGVYGIRHAATHYFNTTPAKLSAAQAFFLISILPAPTIDYFERDGSLSPARLSYVQHLLKVANQRGRLSDAELEYALDEEPQLGQSETARATPLAPGEHDTAHPLSHHDQPSGSALNDDSPETFGIPTPAALRPRAAPPRTRDDARQPAAESSPERSPLPEDKDQAKDKRLKVDPRRRGIHL